MNELKEDADFQENTTPTLGADEVLIKVCAATINGFDVLRYKRDKEDEPLIRECSGCIIKVGRNVTRWRIGDKVCALLKGIRYAEEVVVSSKCVLRVPSNIPLVKAAGFPLETCNAHYAINTCLELSKGDILVVHEWSFLLALCVIEIAKHYGVRVFVVSAYEEDTDIYKRSGAEAFINVRKENIVERVRSLSGMEGANGVICYGVHKFAEYSQCLAKDGVILLVSDGMQMQVKPEITVSLGHIMLACARIIVCNMYSLLTSMDEKSLESLIREVERYGERTGHEIKYLPSLTMPASEIKTAVGLIERGRRDRIILATEDTEELSLVSKAWEIFKAYYEDIVLKRKVE